PLIVPSSSHPFPTRRSSELEIGFFFRFPFSSSCGFTLAGAPASIGVHAQTSHWWLRYEPPNAAMKKRSASVYSCAHFHSFIFEPSKYPITHAPTVDIATNMLF